MITPHPSMLRLIRIAAVLAAATASQTDFALQLVAVQVRGPVRDQNVPCRTKVANRRMVPAHFMRASAGRL